MKFFEKHLLTLHQFGIDSAPFMDKWIYIHIKGYVRDIWGMPKNDESLACLVLVGNWQGFAKL